MKSSVVFARTRLTDCRRSRISRGRSSSNSSRGVWPSATSSASLDRIRHPKQSRRRHCVRMLYKSARSRAMRRPMSQLNRNLFSAREEERLLKGALGCAIPEFIARFGAADAIKRVELELRRALRARSRKLHAFWSAVLAQIAPPAKESSIRKRAEERGQFDRVERPPSHEGAQ